MRDRPAKLIPASHQPVVIFHGTPSQVINLPDLLGIFGAIGVLGVVFAWVSTRWAVSPAVIVVSALVCLAYLALICVQTAFTEIVIDMERITCREGIVTRKVSSVELFRIQNVVSLQPWWQRFFNVGTIVVTTSDPAFPRWYLHGMVDAQRLRNMLNWSAIALRDRKGIRELNIGRV